MSGNESSREQKFHLWNFFGYESSMNPESILCGDISCSEHSKVSFQTQNEITRSRDQTAVRPRTKYTCKNSFQRKLDVDTLAEFQVF